MVCGLFSSQSAQSCRDASQFITIPQVLPMATNEITAAHIAKILTWELIMSLDMSSGSTYTLTHQLTHDVQVSLCNAVGRGSLHFFGDVELTECHEAWHHVAIGELQNAYSIAFLNGGVVSVEVFKEGQEILQ